jgi:G3E family GTPase
MSTTHTAIPATIIGGYLGSGKTTLLNHILQGEPGIKVAVLVNDFGDINIDSRLVTNNDGKVISLANGCICCSISDDLVGQLQAILGQQPRPEYLLIEASGVSDPGRIARTLNYPAFRGRIKLDGILSLLDASQFVDISDEFRSLAMRQLEVADIVIINKTDQCTKEQLEALKAEWLFPDSRAYETQFAEVPLALIIGIASDGGKARDFRPESHSHDHTELFASCSWECAEPLELSRLKTVISGLPTEVFRAKGIFHTREFPGESVVLQQVGSSLDWSREALPTAGDSLRSSLVMIGKNGKLNQADIAEYLERELRAQ